MVASYHAASYHAIITPAITPLAITLLDITADQKTPSTDAQCLPWYWYGMLANDVGER
jgi:hypothetical protein